MNSKKHSLTLDSRSILNITAVDEVISFEETLISISIDGNILNVSGEGLSIKNLSIDCGDIAISGRIDALVYFDSAATKKRFSLFGRK